MEPLSKFTCYMVKEDTDQPKFELVAPKAAADFCINGLHMDQSPVEQVYVLFVDTTLKVIGHELISQGGISASIVEIRSVYRCAILSNAAHIIVVHNHPSGSVKFSKQDRETFEAIREAGNLLQISLLDFIIIGHSDNYFSFQEHDLF